MNKQAAENLGKQEVEFNLFTADPVKGFTLRHTGLTHHF